MYELNMIYKSFYTIDHVPRVEQTKLFPEYNELIPKWEHTHTHTHTHTSLLTQLDYLRWEMKNKLNISVLLRVCLRGKSVVFVEISMAVRITICWAAVIRWRWTLQTLETPGKFDQRADAVPVGSWHKQCLPTATRNIEASNDLIIFWRLGAGCVSVQHRPWWSWWRWSSPDVCSTSTIFRECNSVVGNIYTQQSQLKCWK